MESSFISLVKWGIKEGRRRACAPPAYLKLPFSLPAGEGRGGAPYLITYFFPPCIYTPFGSTEDTEEAEDTETRWPERS